MSLLDLISQNQPHFQTHQALLLLGLQNDFIQPQGKLPVNTYSGFLDRIDALIPKFRQLSANVIWVKTLYQADRLASDPTTGEGDAVVVDSLVDRVESSTDEDDDLPKHVPQLRSRSSKHKQRALDLLKRVSTATKRAAPREEAAAVAAAAATAAAEEDEELFLLQASRHGPACLPNTPGAEFAHVMKSKMERSDTVLQTTNYSAFQDTSLLLLLRAKLVTELYVCGCITNISVLATVIDAARHGIKINVVEDCLGFRKQHRHDIALRRMVDFLDADLITSADVGSREAPDDSEQPSADANNTKDAAEELGSLVDRLQLQEANPTQQRQKDEAKSANSRERERERERVSIAESRTTVDSQLSDDQFAEMLSQGARVPSSEQSREHSKQNLVKSKVRMRSRGDKKHREKERKPKGPPPSVPDEKPEPSSSAEKAAAQPGKTGTDAAPNESPRTTTTVAKAESSDRLRDRPLPQPSLKSSASHPTLPSSRPNNKEKPSPSRMHLAQSRAPRTDPQTAQSDTPSPKKTEATSNPDPTPPRKAAAAGGPDKMGKKFKSLATLPTLGPGDRIAEGDSRIIHDFLPLDFCHPSNPLKPLKDVIFQQLYNEVRWQKMLHQQGEVPRLVCCQGDIGADGSMPTYRHPSDQALPLLHFSPKVRIIQRRAEKLVGHSLNHVLIQLYRSGSDYISEHSDKTLDVVKGSSIVNVSFGAQRTMRLRKKKAEKSNGTEEGGQRETQRVAMPHNSMFVLGLKSNEKWLHGINADKRLEMERSEVERAYSGIRLSLTFRHIGTYLDADSSTIWGQGATSKDQDDPSDVINNDETENERMVRAFSRENHSTEFDWDEHYGDGFDVLHFSTPPEDLPIFFASKNKAESNMIKLFLGESKIKHMVVEMPELEEQYEQNRPVAYRDNDPNHTEVTVSTPVLLYLDRYHPLDRSDASHASVSRSYDICISVSAMLKFWLNRHVPTYHNDFVNIIGNLEEQQAMGPGPYIAGRRFAIGDCEAWPALDEIIENWDGWSEERFPHLTEYYRFLWKKKRTAQKLRRVLPEIRKRAARKDKEATRMEGDDDGEESEKAE